MHGESKSHLFRLRCAEKSEKAWLDPRLINLHYSNKYKPYLISNLCVDSPNGVVIDV